MTMVFDPRVVESKHRRFAWVVAALMGVFLLCYLGSGMYKIFQKSARNEPPVTVSVSSHWGNYPNIWVCHGGHTGKPMNKQIEAEGAQYRNFGHGVLARVAVATNTSAFPATKYQNLAGVPFERNQSCAVAKFSGVADDGSMIMRLYMQVRAVNFTEKDSVIVFAEAVYDSTTQRDMASVIRLFKPGVEGFTKQNCALTKTRFGVRHIFSKSFESRYTCPSAGSEPPRKGMETISIEMFVDKSTVMVLEESGLDFALVKFLVPIGSILGLLTAVSSLCFVPQNPTPHRMTLRDEFHSLDEEVESGSEDIDSFKAVG